MTTSAYTPELAEKICAGLADGKSLRAICKLKGMPSKATVFVWLRNNPEFANMYGIARDDQADVLADQVVEIADNAGSTKGGINKARLMIDARKWFAGVTRPKKYGSKVTQEHTGAGGGPITQTVTVEYVGVSINEDPDRPGV
jgi:hypothetical protein